MKHCCIKMEGVLEEPGTPICYKPYIRGYCMQYGFPPKHRNKNEVTLAETLDYCPWCGVRLPKELFDEWAQIVREKFNISNILDQDELAQLPKEYTTEEWWEKRDL